MGKMKDLKDYLNESIEVTVYNAEDTTSDPKEYGYDSWREYWEDHGHDRNDESLKPINAKLSGDENKELVKIYRCPKCKNYFHWDGELPDCFDGCHVFIKGEANKKLYLTPLCHGCNHEKGAVTVLRRMLEVAPPKKNKNNN